MNNLQLILKAASFAARAHSGQTRKGASAQPYIQHPVQVADLIANIGNVVDAEIIAAALLHDTVEDCGVSGETIESEFGAVIAGYVLEVTDDKSLPKERRKALQVEHAPHLSPGAKIIKLADKISNCTDVMHDPPSGWDKQRLTDYIQWGCNVVRGLRGANPSLEAMFDEVVEQAEAKFDASFVI